MVTRLLNDSDATTLRLAPMRFVTVDNTTSGVTYFGRDGSHGAAYGTGASIGATYVGGGAGITDRRNSTDVPNGSCNRHLGRHTWKPTMDLATAHRMVSRRALFRASFLARTCCPQASSVRTPSTSVPRHRVAPPGAPRIGACALRVAKIFSNVLLPEPDWPIIARYGGQSGWRGLRGTRLRL